MKKTYITNMPNNIGAFLQASKCFAALDINITRVSYNKAVDSHTLFIDVQGEPDKLAQADRRLAEIGYLQKNEGEGGIMLIEFQLRDVPGSVTGVLELIEQFNFNISYISSQENATDYQFFKMGLRVDDAAKVSEFLAQAEKLCNIKVIDYNRSEKIFDNSIFYNSFVSSLIEASGIPKKQKDELLINTNLAMQMLDEQGLSPYRTFDSISKFANMLASCKGDAFSPRISSYKIGSFTEITVIEPPCGSNTVIIKSAGEYLFIDSGYAYYKDEMLSIFKKLIPDFDSIEKTVLLTHMDVDHAGLLPLFDKILASKKSHDCLCAEFEGREGFRELNPRHMPYVRICKALTAYVPADPEKMMVLGDGGDMSDCILRQIGFYRFGELFFEVYEGAGGHLPGEIVLIDYTNRIAFTGDIYVNTKGMTSEQKQYNQYAPILMTSVDTIPDLCAAERNAVMQRLGAGKWQIFGAHGAKYDYELKAGNTQ